MQRHKKKENRVYGEQIHTRKRKAEKNRKKTANLDAASFQRQQTPRNPMPTLVSMRIPRCNASGASAGAQKGVPRSYGARVVRSDPSDCARELAALHTTSREGRLERG